MTSRKLLPRSHFNPIPPIIRNSLHWSQEPTTQSNPPFLSKGPNLLATDLIKSYFEKGSIKEARKVFDEMSERDVVTWTAMIAGYASCSHHSTAWAVFCEMVRVDMEPNAFTFSSVLKACKGMKALSCGAMVHGSAVKYGMKGSMYVENALMDMYATCCVSMDNACKVFNDLHEKNAVSWTTLITGYTHRGDGYGGLQVFRKMLLEEVEPNPFSFSIAIRACASIGSHAFGRQIHSAVIKYGFESNLPVMNSILDMYCRFGCLSEANQYFDEMSKKDLITWNALISGYERLDPRESLRIFSRMELEGFSPNCFTLTSVTAACANLAVFNCGEQVHGGIIRRGFNKNLALANALIDMYAKCGSITDSHKIFSEMSDRDLVSWTSMMLGYGDHGYGKEAVELFDEMVKSGIRPDRIVFMAVLSACSHAGLVDEGLRYFKSMINVYKVTPDKDIYGCVVDLLCRAGRIEEAYELIESMPFKPDESVWGALLGACRAHKLPHLSRLAAQRILDLRPNMAGTYVMLSNFYAAEGKWGEFANMRMLMRGMGNKKEAGQSWIEVRNQVYSFVVGDKMGSHIKWVYGVLELLIWHMKEAEYLTDLDCSVHDQDDGT
ncbi:putative tetratricopeptide-like helical domain-containing protein [Rosa chinensis]|uniref:Putative tetratricopeptide-like helical domain-containing protein n=1 Tax=Rosa chinensis TaxID=74649 RepID=A0A2P6R7N3_ROSCH|nr:putative pentatricopeptide repeat-containing protein At1g56570 [Rosa chinensis]PRQ42431.1 putative tetratricopeptide-like helical domain-containing protein [Rosa chinensis]